MAILGIDLGTSNTLVAKLNDDQEPVIVEINQKTMTPSFIHLEDLAGNPTVGHEAVDYWEEDHDPELNFRRWKLDMGEDHVIRTVRFGGAGADEFPVTPEVLTTLMVEHVVKHISEGDDGEKVESVLVTVPHGWRREKPEKCRATRMAAAQSRIGGKPLKVQQITVSEPVAAAAYWLYIARKNSVEDEFIDKTIMVCDVGGGTFDLSLVLVGNKNKPLDVVDASNNEFAGDYTDALLCAWACRQFNEKFGTDYPATAEQVLEMIADSEHAWIRKWFNTMKEKFKEGLCGRITANLERKRDPDLAKPITESLDDPLDNHLKLTLTVQEFTVCLEPFYEQSRKLVRSFLTKISDKSRLPFALVFAGGGSRIHGLREQVVIPVLKEFYSESEVHAVLKRIEPNRGRLDHAIALGAALIANGVVSVQERLLHDIGMIAAVGPSLLSALDLPATGSTILVTPLLPRTVCLPARISRKDLGLPCSVEPGKELELNLVIDDDSKDPWIQSWLLPHPARGNAQSLDWVIEADTDGALTMHIQPVEGQTITVEGRLERTRTGRASIIFGDSASLQGDVPRLTPQKLIETWKKLGGVA